MKTFLEESANGLLIGHIIRYNAISKAECCERRRINSPDTGCERIYNGKRYKESRDSPHENNNK